MPDNTQFSVPLAIKFSATSQPGEFTGYASTVDLEPDLHGDTVGRGAFAKTIAAHRAAGTAPALLWSHDINQPLGVITQLKEDSRGLFCEGRLTLEVARAAEAHALMKAGALAFSIGYQTVASTTLSKRVRRLDEVKLHEISCVSLPANPNAKLISVKVRPQAVDQHDPRIVEKILRDAGISRLHAKRIISIGKAAFRQRDVVLADDLLARKLIEASRAIQNSL